MTLMRVSAIILALVITVNLAACGKDEIKLSCDEPRPYQSVTRGKKILVPEGLDPLDEYREMPIPQALTPPRPEDDKRCLESPPAIR